MGKIVPIFNIGLQASEPTELTLANFFKSSKGKGKDKVLEALFAYYYSLALSSESTATPVEIELAALDVLGKLQHQISYIVNYHRLYHGINLLGDSVPVVSTSEFNGRVDLPEYQLPDTESDSGFNLEIFEEN